MPDPVVAPVHALREHAVQMAHEQREICVPGVQHNVIVVAHQTIAQHLGIEALGGLRQNVEQQDAILIIDKDRFPSIATRSDVIDGTGELDAQRASHGLKLGER